MVRGGVGGPKCRRRHSRWRHACEHARWCGLDVSFGRYFLLTVATLSIVSYEHNRAEPAIRLWNDARHVGD